MRQIPSVPHRVRSLSVLLGCLLGVGLAGAVSAAESSSMPTICPICHHANNQEADYGEKAGYTLLRGATNTVFGWTEILTEPAAEAQRNGNLVVGIGKGVQNAVVRTAEGLGEVLTFWMPKGPKGYPKISTDCPICHAPLQPAAPSKSTTKP